MCFDVYSWVVHTNFVLAYINRSVVSWSVAITPATNRQLERTAYPPTFFVQAI